MASREPADHTLPESPLRHVVRLRGFRVAALVTGGIALAYGLGSSTSTAAPRPSAGSSPTPAPVCIVSNPAMQAYADVSGPEAQPVCDWASNADLQGPGPLHGSLEMRGAFGGGWEGPAVFTVMGADGTQAVIRSPRGDSLELRQFGDELTRAELPAGAG
jgi:hypothetical protein